MPSNATPSLSPTAIAQLKDQVKQWAKELGFQDCGIASTDLGQHKSHLANWLDAGYHGELEYMSRHGTKRSNPAELVPGTVRVISLRMDYWPESAAAAEQILGADQKAYVSRYTLGRDYHKLIRKRLAKLGQKLTEAVANSNYRVFVDSAPVLERGLAELAGLGWIGKNTMLIHPQAGSYFFLAELFTDIPLPVDQPFSSKHCGSCRRCLDLCPTQAFVGPHLLDARRCISYLTIELKGSIPEELRPLIGNRVFGCDDCQLVCPWNKFTRPTTEQDFSPRHQLDRQEMIALFAWTEEEFLQRTEGSAIRRTGYAGWLRNLAVALGNATPSEAVIRALQSRADHPSVIVREHVTWALVQLKRHPLYRDRIV